LAIPNITCTLAVRFPWACSVMPKAKAINLTNGMSRQRRGALSRRQQKFIQAYANGASGSEACRTAGYSASTNDVLASQAYENLRKPHVKAALERLEAEIAVQITPNRVKRRLAEISEASQEAGQFGPAVRAEELLGKSIGMWIDQSLHLQGV